MLVSLQLLGSYTPAVFCYFLGMLVLTAAVCSGAQAKLCNSLQSIQSAVLVTACLYHVCKATSVSLSTS